ncbi:ChaN family lipoprotein [Fimbriimonas ginsengisoli]|uniref:Haem-binding uptake Tiki superfamily ChaN domain-containing protein n=1 Tax=Fimbriimonas ginsengisoli Gsoil 348 TaxID=661478 RepID=A0A068NLF7_FIMGI|nr:ChaN family lipoprotein [Fimbriimonas ginsengisoli]AIE83565.1 hypothetical protein OP10G_0197 [Fimbriimonas ginsengisoli Gsoil 348]
MLAAALLFVRQDPSPLTLPIGRPGKTTIAAGRLADMRTGAAATADDIAKAADGKRFVFLGEQHATAPCQILEAAVVDALARRGRHVVVGLEMYQRPKQSVLDSFGQMDETAFLEQSDWKKQWGFDFSYYRPVFDVVRKFRIPLVGLNVPRDWVRSVGKGGFAGLPAEAKGQLPDDMKLDISEHRQVFDSLMGGHSNVGPSMENMYSAQVLWDEGMADTAIRYLAAHKPDRKTVFVVIAGSGHVMYGQGINRRIERRKAGDGLNVVMTESAVPVEVSNGIGDFVYVSPPPRTQG